MAMTKAEKAQLEDAILEAAIARALRFPTDEKPAPMTADEIKASLVPNDVTDEKVMSYKRGQKTARGWYINTHSVRVSLGCSDGTFHSTSDPYTTSQGMGVMYRTEQEAWRALRHEKVRECAIILAGIDRKIDDLRKS